MLIASVAALLAFDGFMDRSGEGEDGPPAGERAVVLELFTSQGCSSCPPADALLRRIAASDAFGKTVVPLAFHVDYWNDLGWRDPYSDARWTDRQSDYAAAMGAATLYTPQLVVQGRESFVGSRAVAIEDAIRKAAGEPAEARIGPVEWTVRGDTLAVSTRVDSPSPVQVQFVLFQRGLATEVTRGENKGKRLENDYVVRSLVSLPARSAGASAEALLAWPPAVPRDRIGLAVLVRDPGTLHIVAASQIDVRVDD
ncbi:MAG: DUF1223 domain-containing protein [Rhodothermales bacterium]